MTDLGTPCQLWTGAVDKAGYGHLYAAGRRQLAHRHAYETRVGPIPEGLTLDHLCRVRSCVNTDHLEPVTLRVNLHRSPFTQAAINAARTHCPQGHPYDAVNTYIPPGTRKRQCRACNRERQREWQRTHTSRRRVAADGDKDGAGTCSVSLQPDSRARNAVPRAVPEPK